MIGARIGSGVFLAGVDNIEHLDRSRQRPIDHNVARMRDYLARAGGTANASYQGVHPRWLNRLKNA